MCRSTGRWACGGIWSPTRGCSTPWPPEALSSRCGSRRLSRSTPSSTSSSRRTRTTSLALLDEPGGSGPVHADGAVRTGRRPARGARGRRGDPRPAREGPGAAGGRGLLRPGTARRTHRPGARAAAGGRRRGHRRQARAVRGGDRVQSARCAGGRGQRRVPRRPRRGRRSSRTRSRTSARNWPVECGCGSSGRSPRTTSSRRNSRWDW